MRFDFALRYDKDNLICQISSLELRGGFLIDFNNESVEFIKKYDLKDASLVSMNHTIIKNQMQPKILNGEKLSAKGYSFPEKTLKRKDKTLHIFIEYLEGKIPYHTHPENTREAYLSLSKPYIGQVCGYNQGHETFSERTLAIKVIEE